MSFFDPDMMRIATLTASEGTVTDDVTVPAPDDKKASSVAGAAKPQSTHSKLADTKVGPKKMLVGMTGLVLGALALVVALAWNSAVQNTIETIIPHKDQKKSKALRILNYWIYAVVVTLVVCFIFYVCYRLGISKKNSVFD